MSVGPADLSGEQAVRIRLVGPLLVTVRGHVVPAAAVGSRKARALLALLATEHGRHVGIDRIIDALWGEAPPRRPAENVATLVSRLRASLGAATVVGGQGRYRLGRRIEVDLSVGGSLAAVAGRQLATGDSAAALATAGQALRLLDGEILQDEPGAAWTTQARATHAELLRWVRHTTTEAALLNGNPRRAIAAAQAAVRADPLDEVAHRALMRAYATTAEPARALAVYGQLRAALAGELGIHPSRPTLDLHAAILQDRIPLLQADQASSGLLSERIPIRCPAPRSRVVPGFIE